MDLNKSSELMKKKNRYFDFNATTPVQKDVIEGIRDVMKMSWKNPSSHYAHHERDLMRETKDQLLKLMNVEDLEYDIIFTSGGTEGNNWILSEALNHHCIIFEGEHPSIMNYVNRNNIKVSFIKLQPNGVADLSDISKKIEKNTKVVSMMLAHNETGIIQPVQRLFQIIKENWSDEFPDISPPLFHSDISQAVGKMDIDLAMLGCDICTITGHKFYGPRNGCVVGKRFPSKPFTFGGGQQNNFRSGTENLPMIFGLGRAAGYVRSLTKSDYLKLEELRNYFEKEILSLFPNNIKIYGKDCERLINTSFFSLIIDGYTSSIDFSKLLHEQFNIDIGTGSACHDGKNCSNRTCLQLMGISEELCHNTYRISIGYTTTIEDINYLLDAFRLSIKIDKS
ncbi:hypothetical protein SNEBB_004835 [Seison nebaliae]|nr:hypothetical protein SNEBB_004835 [Seison nebaliae]